jgi:hypothetical protein
MVGEAVANTDIPNEITRRADNAALLRIRGFLFKKMRSIGDASGAVRRFYSRAKHLGFPRPEKRLTPIQLRLTGLTAHFEQ